jgi:hypothetical protein
MVVAVILACEAAFWIVLGTGLAARYLLRWQRTSTVLLLGLPAVDLALLVVVALDLAHGAQPRADHSLAAYYLGFTVAFGHPLVKWADARFAARFTGAPKPVKAAKGSAAYVKGLWQEWYRVVAAAAVATACFGLMAVVANGGVPADPGSDPLIGQSTGLWGLVGIWLLAGPAFAKRDREPAGQAAQEPDPVPTAEPAAAPGRAPARTASAAESSWM